MGNRNYIRGVALERLIKKELEADGWSCIRASGSHGFADVVAVKNGHVKFIQCKVTTKATNQLIKEFVGTCPCKWSCGEDAHGADVIIEPLLVIKEVGSSKYNTYSVYGEKLTNVR